MRSWIAVWLVAGCLVAPAQAGGVKQLVPQSRAIVKQFGAKLKGELMGAMKSGGPVKAIDVCRQEAPAIAAEMSLKFQGKVGRTSLKVRNPNNKPDAWETAVLKKFEARKAAGENLAKMEFSEVIKVNGKKTFRYMKAISTAGACLACHGGRDDITPAVVSTLQSLYPKDRARGFKKGDIRGAFTISKQL